MSKLKILICGLGYTSRYLIEHFKEHEYKILTRNPSVLSSELIYNDNFFPDIVLDTIPPVIVDLKINNPIYKEILLKIYNKKKFVYVHISSTSIYPEIPMVFNEQTDLSFIENIQDEKGKLRWLLEEEIIKYFPYSLILRAGGIYGPERNLVKSLVEKKYNHIPRVNKIVYRIHVYDLCQLIIEGGKILIEKGIEVSVFPGYKRKNLIHAISLKHDPILEVLLFIKEQFNLNIPEFLITNKNLVNKREIQSLYQHIINYKFPDYKKGFMDSYPIV